MNKEYIVCKQCGDEVEKPDLKVAICYQCYEENNKGLMD